MLMHVAIALVTYNLLVHAAPVRRRLIRRKAAGPGLSGGGAAAPASRGAGLHWHAR